MKVLALSEEGLTFRTSFNLDYLLESPNSKYSCIGGYGFNEFAIWIMGHTIKSVVLNIYYPQSWNQKITQFRKQKNKIAAVVPDSAMDHNH